MRGMKRSLLAGGSLIIAVVLLIAANIVVDVLFKTARLDVTQEQLYTLSEGSRAIVADLDEPVTLHYYYSAGLLREVPHIRAYAERIEELLHSYVEASDGMLRLKVIDPQPFSEAEDRAVEFGIRGVPINDVGDVAYFGLAATDTTDGEAVVPFFSNTEEDLLEYQLSRLIYNLQHPEQPKVLVVSSLPINGALFPGQNRRESPWFIMDYMRQTFDVEIAGAEIRAGDLDAVDVLMLAHPKGLSERTLYQIDQYLMRGGHVIAFIDPYSDVEMPPRDSMMPGRPQPKMPSEPGGLLTAWGIDLPLDRVVGDRRYARKVAFGEGAQARSIGYVPWMLLSGEALDADDPLTSQLSQINLATAGSIGLTADSQLEMEPLLRSSANSMLIESVRVQNPPDPAGLLDTFEADDQRHVLAARLRGPVRSAYPGGPPADDADADADTDADAEAAAPPPADHLDASREPVNLVLVADSDMLFDGFWVQARRFYGERVARPFADNGNFVVNALDVLSGSDDLISIRGQGSYARPFRVVEDISRAAEEKFRATEQRLIQELQAIEQQVRELQAQRGDEDLSVPSPEQREQLDRYNAQRLQLRKDLRAVRRELREDIEQLQMQLRFVNIGLIPLLIIVGALLALALRQLRRRSA